MTKICVVGPEESKWKPEQIPKAKKTITDILMNHYTEYDNYGQFEPELEVILVSGHCPKGGVDIWAEEVADKLGIKNEIHAPEVNQWEDRITDIPFNKNEVKEHHIDITGLRFDGYYYYQVYKQKGYRSRNIDMAKTCDVLYCIVPFDNSKYCIHHEWTEKDKEGNIIHYLPHPKNGGCWTLEYAKKLGKEVYLVVIE